MKLVAAVFGMLACTTGAMAVSVGELIGKCGDDAMVFCDGDAMTQCFLKHRADLRPQCKLVVDRLLDSAIDAT